MQKRPSSRTHIHACFLATRAWVAVGRCKAAAAQGLGEPACLKNRTGPVHDICSRTVLGYAFNQKCRQLDAAATETCERHRNQATVIRQGDVIAQKFVPNPSDAIPCTQGLLRGAARSAGSSECDARAQDKVRQGDQTAQSFMPLVRERCSAPAPKPWRRRPKPPDSPTHHASPKATGMTCRTLMRVVSNWRQR